jgi:hypothetical protein
MAQKGSRDTAGSSVESLVQTIRKNKAGFKRLAGYSIECLIKLIAPPASNWLSDAITALNCGAVEAIAEILQGPTTADGGIFLQAVVAINAMVRASARGAQAVADSAHYRTILTAFAFYWDVTLREQSRAAAVGGAPPKELEGEDRNNAVAAVKMVAEIMMSVARQAPQALLGEPLAISALMRLAYPVYGKLPFVLLDPLSCTIGLQCLIVVRASRGLAACPRVLLLLLLTTGSRPLSCSPLSTTPVLSACRCAWLHVR